MNIKLLLLTLVTVISTKSYPQQKNDSLIHRLHLTSGIEKADLLNEIAYACRLDETELALEYATEAAALSDSLNYEEGRGYASYNLGFISYLNGEFESAILILQTALELANHTGDIQLKKRAYETIALIQEESGNPQESLKYYQLSYGQSRLLNDPVGMGISLMGVGRIYEKMNQHTIALQNNLRVKKLFLNLGNNIGVARSCIMLAINHYALDHRDSMGYYFSQAEDIILALDYQELLLDLYLEKIRIYGTNSLDSALQYADQAIALSGILNRPYLKRDLLLQTSDMYSQQGEFQLAYDFHQRYTQLNDSLIHLQQPFNPGRPDLMLNDALYSSQESMSGGLDIFGRSESVLYGRLLKGFGILILCLTAMMVWLAFRHKSQKKSMEQMNILQSELSKLTKELANKDKAILDLRMVKREADLTVEDELPVEDANQLHDQQNLERDIRNDSSTGLQESFMSAEWDKLKPIRHVLSIKEPTFRLPDDTEHYKSHLNLEKMTSLLVKFKSRECEHRINIHHAGNPVINMYCHPGSILLLIHCLLQNAIEAIEEKGDIFIDYQAEEEMIRYRIMDNGMGIAPEDLNQIFEPFFSAYKSNQHLGLGLSLSREIVRAHNAVMKVNSKVGTGTEIMVEFYYS